MNVKNIRWISKDASEAIVTVVDNKQIAVATYKNLAFQCDIYIMKGDKSTVKKFSLLIVLRDFQEEYTVEIDGSSN